MDPSRHLDCLAADFARLRSLVPLGATAPVPTCPGWTVADLARHVGEVYLHKARCIEDGAEPVPWPPEELAQEDPAALLDRGYAALRAAFTAHAPGDRSGTWYAPDPTVGFWYRRMAQETVIHRIDAELAAGQSVEPVPDDLAVDGVDELFKVFVAYSVREWGEEFTDTLASSPGRTFAVRTEGAAWRLRTAPGVFTVEDGDDGSPADVTLEGPPEALLRRLWNREGGGTASRVTVTGAPEALAELRGCVVTATQ